MAERPTYITYRAMLQRCYDETHQGYEFYGGRGIKVCPRWKDKKLGFRRFLADVGQRPRGKTLDRIDPDGDYRPDNVRWATAKMQAANKRDVV